MTYRKASELIEQVSEDLDSYSDQGLIDASKLYKILRRCNGQMGQRINPEKDQVIHVKDYRSYLPEDFLSLNYAFICKTRTVNVGTPNQGFHVEYKTVCTKDNKCKVCVDESCGEVCIYQLLDENWTQFKDVEVLRVNPKSFNMCHNKCPNTYSNSPIEMELGSDGLVTTNFQNGWLYLNYTGSMEDEDGELLILDDPNVEGYYEGEIVKQILKTALYNKNADISQIYGDAKVEASRARTQALSYVSTWGYDEMRNVFQNERKHLYNKYFRPILGDYC